MAHDGLAIATDGRVGIVTFDMADRMNALSFGVMTALRARISAWNADPGIGAIVLTGAGRAFSAGWDLRAWDSQIAQREQGAGRVDGDRVTGEEEFWTTFVQRSKPVVCAINGAAIGAGLSLTLPCDVRIASDQARLSARFIRAGVFPELASTQILPQIVGVSQALELLLTARIIDAAEAGRIGLVNRVVPHDQLMETALATAREIAFNPTESLLGVKKLVWEQLSHKPYEDVQAAEGAELAAAMSRPHFKEAVRAFLEKRQPDFHAVG